MTVRLEFPCRWPIYQSMLARHLFTLLSIVLLAVGPVALTPQAVAQTTTDIRLLLEAAEAPAGSTVMAAVQLRMQDSWHSYWRNPGGSGQATRIDWQLPEGITAGEVLWPVPEKLPHELKELHTHVLHNDILLLVPLTVSAGKRPGSYDLQARVSWQECLDVCIPGRTNVTTKLIIGSAIKPSNDAALFDAARRALPQTNVTVNAAAYWEAPPTGEERPLVIEWTPGSDGEADLFPYPSKGYALSPWTDKLPAAAGAVKLRKIVSEAEGGWPTSVSGVLVQRVQGLPPKAFEVTLNISPSPAGLATQPLPRTPLSLATLLPMLGAALLGGLILNIMPCVLPVLALTILSFVHQASASPRRVRELGLIYGAGVLVSFLALALVALLLQKAGAVAGWGSAFQSPVFRVCITVLITLVALNLFGVFEVVLGGSTMDNAAQLTAKEGAAGAFFNGVLAAVLATPCTAPFLATAIGFAFTQPPLVLLLIFLAVGAGLALPFVLLCWNPAWLKLMPKPGRWMERFKVAMGFPMLATAVWLFWVTATRMGEGGVLWFGLFLVLLAAAAWVYGEFVQRGARRRSFALAVTLGLVVAAYGGLLEGQLDWRTPASQKKAKIDWQPWSPDAVAKARAEKRPVLVDFTAATCLNCKFNKRTSIEIDSTITKLKQINAVTLTGDFTDADPQIAAELQKHGRRGVPLVLVYSKDAAKEPKALPTLLTPTIVHEALDWAGK